MQEVKSNLPNRRLDFYIGTEFQFYLETDSEGNAIYEGTANPSELRCEYHGAEIPEPYVDFALTMINEVIGVSVR